MYFRWQWLHQCCPSECPSLMCWFVKILSSSSLPPSSLSSWLSGWSVGHITSCSPHSGHCAPCPLQVALISTTTTISIITIISTITIIPTITIIISSAFSWGIPMQVGGQLPENATKNWFATQLASSVQVFTLIESHGLVFYLMSHGTLIATECEEKRNGNWWKVETYWYFHHLDPRCHKLLRNCPKRFARK